VSESPQNSPPHFSHLDATADHCSYVINLMTYILPVHGAFSGKRKGDRLLPVPSTITEGDHFVFTRYFLMSNFQIGSSRSPIVMVSSLCALRFIEWIRVLMFMSNLVG
jgi:hypothetical protein